MFVNLSQAGKLRIAKLNPNNPFGSGPLKSWYHVDCFFELKVKNGKTLTSSGDVEGWELLSSEDKQTIIKKVGDDFKETSSPVKTAGKSSSGSEDNKFSEFQRIVGKIANEPSYTAKSLILQKFLQTVKTLLCS